MAPRPTSRNSQAKWLAVSFPSVRLPSRLRRFRIENEEPPRAESRTEWPTVETCDDRVKASKKESEPTVLQWCRFNAESIGETQSPERCRGYCLLNEWISLRYEDGLFTTKILIYKGNPHRKGSTKGKVCWKSLKGHLCHLDQALIKIYELYPV